MESGVIHADQVARLKCPRYWEIYPSWLQTWRDFSSKNKLHAAGAEEPELAEESKDAVAALFRAGFRGFNHLGGFLITSHRIINGHRIATNGNRMNSTKSQSVIFLIMVRRFAFAFGFAFQFRVNLLIQD